MSARKLRVAVVYGGKSGEHEISLISAASVIRNLDSSRFEIIPIAVTKEGKWLEQDLSSALAPGAKSLKIITSGSKPCQFKIGEKFSVTSGAIDVVFPVMHGPLCEDGTIQGFFEISDMPYVGCGTLSSAVGMDKDVAKRLAVSEGIKVVPWVTLKKAGWSKDSARLMTQIERELGFPCFIKPANMGSSVGVHKVKKREDLRAAIEDAFRYDLKVIAEKGIRAREIELSALESLEENGETLVSIPGEITPTHEFYSYESKYLDENGAELMIPAHLSATHVQFAQDTARKVFQVLECEGMARVDFFLDQDSGEFYLNEINTLPGFTQISMYPKLWEASGISYKELLSRLVDLALKRSRLRGALLREWASAK